MLKVNPAAIRMQEEAEAIISAAEEKNRKAWEAKQKKAGLPIKPPAKRPPPGVPKK